MNDYRTMINVTYCTSEMLNHFVWNRAEGVFTTESLCLHMYWYHFIHVLPENSRHCLPPLCIPDNKTCSSTAEQHLFSSLWCMFTIPTYVRFFFFLDTQIREKVALQWVIVRQLGKGKPLWPVEMCFLDELVQRDMKLSHNNSSGQVIAVINCVVSRCNNYVLYLNCSISVLIFAN